MVPFFFFLYFFLIEIFVSTHLKVVLYVARAHGHIVWNFQIPNSIISGRKQYLQKPFHSNFLIFKLRRGLNGILSAPFDDFNRIFSVARTTKI